MSGRRGLGARDLARTRLLPPRDRRLLAPALVGILLAALILAALRIDLIRLRYGLTAAMREERALVEQHHSLTARVQAVRNPGRLARLAGEMGLARPERVIELHPPAGTTGPRP